MFANTVNPFTDWYLAGAVGYEYTAAPCIVLIPADKLSSLIFLDTLLPSQPSSLRTIQCEYLTTQNSS